jgi:hypothetical protein
MDGNCKSVYAKKTLRPLLAKSVMDRMERLEQDDQLKHIDGIEECPFCNFKALLPEGTTDFDCANPECEMSSCRTCRELSHAPRTCEEAKKAKSAGANLNIRHLLEEAMSRAAVRVCHVCRTKFVKEEGCNHVSGISYNHMQKLTTGKIICAKCGASCCYICQAPNVGNNHFFKTGCPLFSNNVAEQEAEGKNPMQ